ncbi:MAG: hypothetical protein AB7P08_12515 [Burkholderiales bacterium]
MSDLLDIANRKIAAERDKLTQALPQRIEATKRKHVAAGMLHSGNTAAALRDLCVELLQLTGAQIAQEYKWAAATAIFLTQSFSRSLAEAADAQLAPMASFCADQLENQLQVLNMAPLTEVLIPSLEAKRHEILTEMRIELDRAFAERRRGVIRNIAIGIGNVLNNVGGK